MVQDQYGPAMACEDPIGSGLQRCPDSKMGTFLILGKMGTFLILANRRIPTKGVNKIGNVPIIFRRRVKFRGFA